MKISFTKMQGLGNDFVLLNSLDSRFIPTAEQVRLLADRRLGVGCDQLLLLEPAATPVAARYRIFNADGTEVGQCGNGSRCVAYYLWDERIIDRDEIAVETTGGIIRMYRAGEGLVRVDMGAPRLNPTDVPIAVAERALQYSVAIAGETLRFCAVSMGNPHAVFRVEDVATAPVVELGQQLTRHRLFPEGANIGFMQVVDATHIRLRVFERGVGETPACGTGACAAVVAGKLLGLLQSRVEVELPGGSLTIEWQGEGTPVWMTGPAQRVFEGVMTL